MRSKGPFALDGAFRHDFSGLRRVVPFSLAPLLWYDFTNTANLWQIADQEDGVANGDPVGYVQPLGSIAHPLIQPNDNSERPTYVANQINGYGALRFQAANSQRLETPVATTLIGATTYVLFVVVGGLGGAGTSRHVFDSLSASQRNAGYIKAANSFGIYAGSEQAGGASSNAWGLWEFDFTGPGSGVIVNGTAVAGPGSVGSQTLDGFAVGGKYDDSEHFEGYLAELMAVSAAVLGGTGRAVLRNHFRVKYNLP